MFKTIDDIVEMGLETPLTPSFWDVLIDEHNLEFTDLEKFHLNNIEEYAEAGLTSVQLANLGVRLIEMVQEGRFTRKCIENAAQFGWTFDDYATLDLDYETLHRLQFGADDYMQLFGLEGWQVAHYLGLFDAHTHIFTQQGREQLRAINIDIET